MTADVSAARQWLAELEQAREKATPGPWISDGHELYAAHSVELGIPSEWVAETCDVDNPQRGNANAELIVAAVNALPRLTSALRAMLDLADELEREGQTQLFHGPHNWNQHITDRIRDAVAAASEEGSDA